MEKELWVPDFIPYFLGKSRRHELKPSEGLVYGFIRFVLRKKKGFFFTNAQIGHILGLKLGTVNNCLRILESKALIKRNTSEFLNGGRKRKIDVVPHVPQFIKDAQKKKDDYLKMKEIINKNIGM